MVTAVLSGKLKEATAPAALQLSPSWLFVRRELLVTEDEGECHAPHSVLGVLEGYWLGRGGILRG